MSQRKRPSRFISPSELAYYRAHFREALRVARQEEDAVVCLECGALRKTLGVHVLIHDLTLDEYRAKWGYNRQTRFAAHSTHEKMRQRALTTGITRYASPTALEKAWEARRGVRTESLRLESRLDRRKARQAPDATRWQRYPDRETEDEVLRTLMAEGHTVSTIAERIGLTRDCVRHRLRALGLVPPIKPRKKVTNQQVLELRAAGRWPHEISAQLGITRIAVLKRLWKLRRRGVHVPTPQNPRPSGVRQVSDQDFLALVREGLDPAEIAARVGLTKNGVITRAMVLRRRGLLIGKRTWSVPELPQQ